MWVCEVPGDLDNAVKWTHCCTVMRRDILIGRLEVGYTKVMHHFLNSHFNRYWEL